MLRRNSTSGKAWEDGPSAGGVPCIYAQCILFTADQLEDRLRDVRLSRPQVQGECLSVSHGCS